MNSKLRFRQGTNKMEMIELESMEEYDKLPVTNWNIKQFNDTSKKDAYCDGGLDLILLPGFAFDLTGNRLGKGGDY